MHKLSNKMNPTINGRRHVSVWQAIQTGAIKTGPVVKVARLKPTSRRSDKCGRN